MLKQLARTNRTALRTNISSALLKINGIPLLGTKRSNVPGQRLRSPLPPQAALVNPLHWGC
ncbi:MAG: hypothetical protein HC840_03285 [Leptolyngbyaceae cyanobacterium RM2_2_4]|nr:hypothetical protein [Leptolyngbyaceae cyanobacterium SM1_4_3]NJN91913.1 hypothetical protein [Leptolyngbyaceae cyanobacterium SL_5_14]NJO48658.1 hypothetical protein [Leptolyngbyaceae cyanobacterium RM2_2_4]NJO76820.1 hypothetical protein [Leptolyngbyaceae cyanobacterium RM1_406_9]